jgi:hypothetical protein
MVVSSSLPATSFRNGFSSAKYRVSQCLSEYGPRHKHCCGPTPYLGYIRTDRRPASNRVPPVGL